MSDPTTIIDQELLREIRCNICKCPPSVGPLRLIDGTVTCGRCPGEGPPAKPLEALASKFKYPCRYHEQGCELTFFWGEAAPHEEVCESELAECFISNCRWSGAKAQMKEHFQDKHPASTFDRTSVIKLLDVKSNLKLLILIGHSAFKIELDAMARVIKCTSEMVLPKFKADKYEYSCKIDFFNEDRKLTFLQEIPTGGGPLHVNKSDLKSIFDELERVKIKITVNYSGKLMMINDGNFPDLKCPVCLDEMALNIYSAVCGHSVCDKCSLKLVTCPLCKYRGWGDIFHIRNYALENVRDYFL